MVQVINVKRQKEGDSNPGTCGPSLDPKTEKKSGGEERMGASYNITPCPSVGGGGWENSIKNKREEDEPLISYGLRKNVLSKTTPIS